MTEVTADNELQIALSHEKVLVPEIEIVTEYYDGGHTFITINFKDYYSLKTLAVVKSSGIGMSIRQDQHKALRAIGNKLRRLF